MKFIVRAALLLALLAVVDGVIFLVLTGNSRAGVYPTNADSIGIPLIESAAMSVVAGILLICCIATSGFSWLRRPVFASRTWCWVRGGAVAITHFLSAAFFALWAYSWAMPHHYLIVATCTLAAAVILYVAAVDLNGLRPNNSSKPTPLRGAA